MKYNFNVFANPKGKKRGQRTNIKELSLYLATTVHKEFAHEGKYYDRSQENKYKRKRGVK